MKNIKILVLAIVALAIFLRFFNLWNTPPAPDWDEVAYGYNAYSILKTGADEYGAKFPVVLRSFDDYKPALYAYLSIPPVALFGLNTFSVRFADAAFGVFGVIACFYLVRTLLKRDDVALLSSFFLSVSPWQIQFSRFSHEAVVGVTFNILTALFFFLGLKRPKLLVLSAVFWALSFYTYQSEKLFSPLLALLLFAIFFKEIFKVKWKYLAASIFAALIILAPMGNYILNNSKALSRAMGTSIFSHQTEILDKSAKQLIEDRQSGNTLGLIVHNRRVVYAQSLVKNYLAHYDPSWLLVKGDLPRHHPPGMGILYYFDLPFILLGLIFLINTKMVGRKAKLFIFGWLLIAPIPAAFTYDVPHAARSLNVLPIPQILVALGVFSTAAYLKSRVKPNIYKLSLALVGLFFILNFSYYFNQYFNKLNYLYSNEWQYGYKEAISYVSDISNKYDRIIVSNQVPLDQSYMFFLFFLKYDPHSYQAQGSDRNFDKFVFKNIDWKKDSLNQRTLIIGSRKDISADVDALKIIRYLDGKEAIIIAQSNK